MSRRCLGCMELFGDEFEICPHCGYIVGTHAEEAIHMEPGTLLYDRYIVGKVIGYGGFGVTYLGWDGKLEQKVAIKEYLPGEFSTRMPGQSQVTIFNGDKGEQFRDGLKKFVEEAKRLAKFQNEEGIVKVFDSFEENDTAYIIMEFLDGETLTSYLKREKTIPEDEAVAMLTPVMESLQAVHAEGILHRDIAPDNIFLTKSGEVKLIDFGASRYATTSHSRSLTVIIKPGFSPEEQYRSRGDQGPYTDVYAIAATLYKMITGKTPPDAMERRAKYENLNKDILEEPHKINKNISVNRENAILNAMNVRIEDRTPDVATFKKELNADPPAKRIYGKIKKIDLYSWPLWLKICVPALLVCLITVGTLLAAGVIKLDSLFSEEIVIPENIVTVPDVEGLYSADAFKLIEDNKLLASTGGNIESEYIAAGKIILQAPVGGTYMDKNGTVVLTVSSGKGVEAAENGISTVPYVIWDTQQDAIDKLKLAGLGEPEIEEAHDDQVAAGAVISQSINAGEKVDEGTVIKLVISIGPSSFEMPDVKGQSITEAEAALTAKGLIVSIEYEENNDVPQNSVIRQNIAEGSDAKRGDEIILVVASRKKTKDVADVVGRTRSDAEKTLKDQGFKVKVLENYDTSVESGKVISQSPSAGSTQIEGAVITIYVSKGKQPVTVSFDANGGSVSQTSATVYYSSAYGSLPTPTRNGYNFGGWFTSANGGNIVDVNTKVVLTSDHTLYAHWSAGGYTVTLNANGGTVTPNSTTAKYGSTYGSLPNPVRAGYTFKGWFTEQNGGKHITSSSSVEISANHTLYAQWTVNKYTVTFNANGGSVSPSTKSLDYGSSYGSLPTPTRDYYSFNGWYTVASGGTKVSASTVVNGNEVLYAHWTEKGLSDWVLASQVPSGGKIVEQKWTYDLITNITSKNPSEPGYTQYNSTWEWGSYGSWSSWSKTAVNKSDSREVETKTVTDSAGYTYYSFYRWRYWNTSYGQWYYTYGPGMGGTYEEATATDGEYSYYRTYDGYYAAYKINGQSGLWYGCTPHTVPAVTHTEYRYRDRSKDYTYYHTKTESEESAKEITASDTIKNVQKWVKYRAK